MAGREVVELGGGGRLVWRLSPAYRDTMRRMARHTGCNPTKSVKRHIEASALLSTPENILRHRHRRYTDSSVALAGIVKNV
jgi:hypothetical protein